MAGDIIKGEDHFFTTTYEGNGGGQKVGKFVPFTDNGTIAKSVIFNDGDNPKLNRTVSSAGNRDTFTMSFWIKRCGGLGTLQVIFQHGADINNCTQFAFDTSNRIKYEHVDSGSTTDQMITNRSFEDTSKFYHIVLAVDTTQSTEANRIRLYVDGDEITSWNTANYPTQNTDTDVNSETGFYISSQISATQYPLDCYLAEVNFVDGTQYTPSTFGITDTSTGRWIPKSLAGISYGTNGFRFQFANSAGQTIGDDTSGQGNDFTVTNIATTDLTTDSPTQNFATLSPTRVRGTISLSEGNRKIASGATSYACSATTLKFSETASQGLYFEVKQVGSIQNGMSVLIMRESVNVSGLGNSGYFTDCFGLQARGGGGGNTYWTTEDGANGYDTSVSHASNDYIQVAFKEGKVWFGINNTWISSGNPATGANPTYNNIAGQDFRFLICAYENNDLECNFGQTSFNYTPPTGFVAVQQDNLPESGKDFADLVWIKDRDSASYSHMFFDSTRGQGLPLKTNSANQEGSYDANNLKKFLNGGFSVGESTEVNRSTSYIAWNWHANGGTTSANTDGSGATIASTIQANDTAGFSIVTYEGTGSNGKVAHGLSAAPHWVVVKSRGEGEGWSNYHIGMDSATKIMTWNNTNAQADSATDWNSTAPTSSIVNVGSNARTNKDDINYVMYCWRPVEGFSKFGVYEGNNNTNGTFIYTGFKPAWVMIKSIDGSTSSYPWSIYDNGRSPTNPVSLVLEGNSTAVDGTLDRIDFLANGFKCRQSYSYSNAGETYIFMAFAEHPFIGSGTNPATAR